MEEERINPETGKREVRWPGTTLWVTEETEKEEEKEEE